MKLWNILQNGNIMKEMENGRYYMNNTKTSPLFRLY